jgi:tRNA 2-selenouridine synthase
MTVLSKKYNSSYKKAPLTGSFFYYGLLTNTFVLLAIDKLHITAFLQQATPHLIIDVRSPKEYQHAHLPGAVNVPIFDNEERKVIGTIYKQQSRELAIKEGLQLFGPKMRGIVEEVEKMIVDRGQMTVSDGRSPSANLKSEIYIYCWRGGMRSGAMAWLLQLYGFKVRLLAGGYKSYRRWALEQLELPYRLHILGGFTGSGKTDVLKQLQSEGAPVIDLEQLANHKGSAFGNLKLEPQPSQEMFENLLALRLYQHTASHAVPPVIWVEDESQRIGLINIPQSFWLQMRQSPVFFLDIPFEERLQYLVKEYGSHSKETLAEGIQRIAKRLGGLEAKNALQHLAAGDIAACFTILLKYYDKVYLKGLHNRTNLSSLLTKINCTAVTNSNTTTLLRPYSSV